MNYKIVKITFLAMMLIFVSVNVQAQNNYISFSLGYGVPTASGQLDAYNEVYNSPESTYERANIGLGKGLNATVTFGLGIHENINFEVNATYLLGSKSTTTRESISNWGNVKNTNVFSSNMVQVSPMLVFSVNNETSKLNPYAKIGIIGGIGKITQELTNTDDNDEIFIKTEYNGGIAFGINGALGTNFKLNDKMSFFGELNVLSMSYAPTKGMITEYMYNGADRLSNLTTNEKEFEYFKDLKIDGNERESEPDPRLANYMPYSNLSLRVGLQFILN